MQQGDESRWNVLYIASRQEKKVLSQFRKLGISAYLPLSKELRQWSDRKKWVEIPMFRGYLFVPEGYRAEQIFTVHGVVGFLKFNGKNAVVRQKDIDIIRQVEQSGYYAEQLLNTEDFEQGETVRVSDGPLRGHEGTILRKNSERFFTLSISGIEQVLKVQVPFELIEKLPSAQRKS